jgi:tripartite-type tricarboxylate transporter receptor subunit TctC
MTDASTPPIPRAFRRSMLQGALGLASAALTGGLLRPGAAQAQEFPSRAMTLVVPFAPGGSTDIAARVVGQKMGELLGRPVIVDNRAGGGTIIGTRFVVRAEADGHTLLYGSNTLALNPTLRSAMPYDTVKDLQPVCMVARQPFVLAVHPGLPVQSVQDLVAYAKARPGAVNFGSAGIGTGNHLAQELFAILAGIQLQHVPYPGDGPMVTDLLAGRIQMTISTLPSVMSFIQAGSLRALGIGDAEPLPQLPQVPPISRAGLPDYVVSGWNAIFLPAGVPPAVLQKLTAVLQQTIADPAVSDALTRSGAVPAFAGPEAMAAYLAQEIARWGEVIRLRGIRLE